MNTDIEEAQRLVSEAVQQGLVTLEDIQAYCFNNGAIVSLDLVQKILRQKGMDAK